MKKLILACLVAALSFPVFAAGDEEVLCLVVAYTNGEEINFALAEEPVITYSNGTITVVGDEYTIEDLDLEDLDRYYFSETIPGGIDGITATDGSSTRFSDGKVYVTGLKGNDKVRIYTVDGRIVGSVSATSDGNACIDLNGLKGGAAYILRTPTTSFKIVK